MGEATAPGQCTETLYTTCGLNRDEIQGTLYAVAQNGTRQPWGGKLYPVVSPIPNRIGVAKSLSQEDFGSGICFGGTIASLPARCSFSTKLAAEVPPRDNRS